MINICINNICSIRHGHRTVQSERKGHITNAMHISNGPFTLEVAISSVKYGFICVFTTAELIVGRCYFTARMFICSKYSLFFEWSNALYGFVVVGCGFVSMKSDWNTRS